VSKNRKATFQVIPIRRQIAVHLHIASLTHFSTRAQQQLVGVQDRGAARCRWDKRVVLLFYVLCVQDGGALCRWDKRVRHFYVLCWNMIRSS